MKKTYVERFDKEGAPVCKYFGCAKVLSPTEYLFSEYCFRHSQLHKQYNRDMKIYLASSWRNGYYVKALEILRARGFEVHDFRDPSRHFLWSDISPDWEKWSTKEYIEALRNPIADVGYFRDKDGLDTSTICILLLPCGRSAHIEAGYMKGQGKRVYALIPEKIEPELMYRVFDGIYWNIHYLCEAIKEGV